MAKHPQQAVIGQRMRTAAHAAGFGVSAVARHLKVYNPTVHRWWTGDRAPSTAVMAAYAELVGKPLVYFYAGVEEEAEQPRQVADLLVAWADQLMAGAAPGAAFDQVTGEPEELAGAERQKVVAAAPAMRDDLARLSGGAWDRLSPAEKEQILEQVVQLAAQRRAPSPDPTG